MVKITNKNEMKRPLYLILTAVILTLSSLDMQADTQKILKIDFKSPITEHGGSAPFSLSSFSFSSLLNSSASLYGMVRAIDSAAVDPNISMIYMTPCNIQAGLSQMEEIRAALQRFRDSGKSIVAYCENLSNASYYVASVADKIVLNPASESFVIGLATQQVFLKDALDALGVDVQLIRHGKYKSAGEMFIRNDISPENYEQNKAMVTSLWNDMCDEIAASRGFSADEFKGWVNSLALTDAESFKELGLVDELWHKDQLDDYFCQENGTNMLNLVNYVPLNRYIDKLAKKYKKQNRKNRKNKVVIIYANGEIATSADGSTMSSGDIIVGKNLARTISKVRKDDNVKAVVFRVNSPGGSVMASELIKREIDLLKEAKPVVASYGEYAASGGYWISACTDSIYTDKTTLTGSIGCFSMVPGIGNAIKKIAKVNIVTIGSSDHSDMMSGIRHLDEAETAYLQRQVEDIYDRFTTIVSEGRGMSKDSVDAIAQGRVWTGSDAMGIGLTDRIGGLADAVACAARLAGLETYALDEQPVVEPFSFMSLFAGDVDVDEDLTSDTGTLASTVIGKVLPFASLARRQHGTAMYARMPYLYSFD